MMLLLLPQEKTNKQKMFKLICRSKNNSTGQHKNPYNTLLWLTTPT